MNKFKNKLWRNGLENNNEITAVDHDWLSDENRKLFSLTSEWFCFLWWLVLLEVWAARVVTPPLVLIQLFFAGTWEGDLDRESDITFLESDVLLYSRPFSSAPPTICLDTVSFCKRFYPRTHRHWFYKRGTYLNISNSNRSSYFRKNLIAPNLSIVFGDSCILKLSKDQWK